MSDNALAASASDSLIHRITEGVGIVRERTIEVGARVIWVDNIGSLVILRGQRNYAMSIVGGLLAIAGLMSLRDSAAMAILLLVIGVGLIALNLSTPINNGLSIGTVDGRSTLIISDNENFLSDTLDLIREKIDTGSITLQGTFDIGSTHVNTGGGGVAIGRGAEALARRQQVERPFPNRSAAALAPDESPDEKVAPGPAPPARPTYSDSFAPVEEPRESRGGARIAMFSVVAFLIVGSAGGGYYWWTQEQARQLAEAQRLEWDGVARSDAPALRAYIEHAPAAYRREALNALQLLEVQREQEAFSTDTIVVYERYLADFPQGRRSSPARERIGDLRRIEAFTQSAPQLDSPADGVAYNHFPRTTLLSWGPVDGAESYIVEVQMWDHSQKRWVEEPEATLVAVVVGQSYSFNFVGAQPGRWRVRGQKASGALSAFSEWRTFQYLR